MSTMKRKVIAKIKENRTSTTEILDIFGKDWDFFMNIQPLNRGSYAVGGAYVVHVIEEANWYIHQDIIDIPEDVIIFVENHGVERAVFGSLVSGYLFNNKRVAAIVSMGNLRDGQDLKEEEYPIWCRDVVAVGCFNKRSDEADEIHKSLKERGHSLDGAILVCDDSGIAIIPEEKQTKEFCAKLDFIQKQEEIWFKCIDEGWSTFRTVCLKEYLN